MGEASDTWQTLPGETAVVQIASQGPSLTRHINDNTRMLSTKYLLFIPIVDVVVLYTFSMTVTAPGTACWGNAFDG